MNENLDVSKDTNEDQKQRLGGSRFKTKKNRSISLINKKQHMKLNYVTEYKALDFNNACGVQFTEGDMNNSNFNGPIQDGMVDNIHNEFLAV